MKEEKYCPIMSNQFEYEVVVCMKEKCAWYDETNYGCIILTQHWR